MRYKKVNRIRPSKAPCRERNPYAAAVPIGVATAAVQRASCSEVPAASSHS